MYLLFLFTILFLFSNQNFSQNENINTENSVYFFLEDLSLKNIINNYDNAVLPLSRNKIVNFLIDADKNSSKLNKTDTQLLEYYKKKFAQEFHPDSNYSNTYNDFKFKNIYNPSIENYLYHFKDSSFSFYINPVFDVKLNSDLKSKGFSQLIDIGGKASGTYNNWLTFYLEGSNALVYGDRETAKLTREVAQSFTFNNTGINYFDGTKGYIKAETNNISLQIGRERLLFGRSVINPLYLSENPQLFDFVKFNINYKKFSYYFVHGWLVRQPNVFPGDSLTGIIKIKPSKYLALSRLNYSANNKLSFGIAQMIIYGDRPFEAAYLNPFLFWESAQRSLEDLDNSLLSFEAKWRPFEKYQLYGQYILDDLNLESLGKGEWNAISNKNVWQLGLSAAEPFSFENSFFTIEYLQVRPYMFSHPGLYESLTYTNNGYMLNSIDQPNSTLLTFEGRKWISGPLLLKFRYEHYIHGDNIYDDKGNTIRNVGGNVFENTNLYVDYLAYLLDGDKTIRNKFTFFINYYITLNTTIELKYNFINSVNKGNSTKESQLFFNLKFFQ